MQPPDATPDAKKAAERMLCGLSETGAGNESRTRDLNLGKVALYQLSYSRVEEDVIIGKFPGNASVMPE